MQLAILVISEFTSFSYIEYKLATSALPTLYDLNVKFLFVFFKISSLNNNSAFSKALRNVEVLELTDEV